MTHRLGGKRYSSTVTFFSNSTLNRNGDIRAQQDQLKTKFQTASILVFKNGKPLLSRASGKTALGFIPSHSFSSSFSQPLNPVYLGDRDNVPIFAIDADMPSIDEVAKSKGFEYVDMRPACFQLPKDEAAILAQGRSLTDWNARNKFCPACGSPTHSISGGYAKQCSNSHCISRKTTQNYSHVRTDPVIITGIISPDSKSMLLGRQKVWTKGLYSCIAGFIEAGESLEDAVRREAYEETGTTVGQVRYHLSQPWPFPNSLMLGCYAQVDSLSEISLVDKELEDAKWFTKDEITDTIRKQTPGRDIKTEGAGHSNTNTLLIPTDYAIAHQLIKAWVEGFKPF
ncbi:NAD+ diphosphatase [Synchytrium microbalum]|uniref:NAD(+) diphosphatase n=1 Tax=Synchytrium microbalum TaxID=1806994 RepID=A0A507CAM1_9FUNG|nr:NAD+ diphosphatase [Synchytrium microbalum]TPX36501.1 NAD+ diphosphatase [Synchytrium microbalum]